MRLIEKDFRIRFGQQISYINENERNNIYIAFTCSKVSLNESLTINVNKLLSGKNLCDRSQISTLWQAKTNAAEMVNLTRFHLIF